jgi:hypothetical protein
MAEMHRQEIARAPDICILAAAHNTVTDVLEWVEALKTLKPKLDRNGFRKLQRPWFAKFNRNGEITSGPRIITWP